MPPEITYFSVTDKGYKAFVGGHYVGELLRLGDGEWAVRLFEMPGLVRASSLGIARSRLETMYARIHA